VAEAEEAAVAVAVAVPQGDLPDVHQVVPVDQVRQVARRVVPRPEALPHSMADPLVPHELASSADSPDRTDYPPSPMVLVRVPVLAFWGVPVLVGFVDPLFADTAGGAVATTGQPPVETTLLTHWSLLWQKGRNWEPLVVVMPSGSMFVGLAGGVGARDGDNTCSGEAIASSTVSSGTSAEVPSLALLSRRRYSLVAMNSHVEVLSTFFK
jgi:hypothetical protein